MTDKKSFESLTYELENPTPDRMFALAQAFAQGMTVEEAHNHTGMDLFFLSKIQDVVTTYQSLEETKGFTSTKAKALLHKAKRQ